ncbi:MAG: hydantoin utilization protein A [Bacteroidia bacterium]
MQASFPLLFALLVGFTHAFEADHLLAVSNIVTKRDRLWLAVKDGIYWGLGHTSTILVIGLLMIVGRIAISEGIFHYFEAAVGCMLVGLGVHRIYKALRRRKQAGSHAAHPHHHEAYGIGAVHGLAGSGALVVLVMSQLPTVAGGLAYLLIFGLGSVAGMLLASGIFSLPFSQRSLSSVSLQFTLTLLSSSLCVWFGGQIIYENLWV